MKKKSEFLKTAIKAAKAAGKIASKQFDKNIEINYKQYKDKKEIVTNVDKECEQKIISTIKKKFKNHSIWSEESPEEINKTKYKWIIDPIDGTINYARGIPLFGISIALEYDNQVIVGVNYFPLLKKLYYAEKDKGAFLNGKQIFVSNNNLKNLVYVTSKLYKKPKLLGNLYKKFINNDLIVYELGSCELHMSLVAEGKADASFQYGIKPGDVAAGIVLVKEAGGKVINSKGKPAKSSDEEVVATGKKIKFIPN